MRGTMNIKFFERYQPSYNFTKANWNGSRTQVSAETNTCHCSSCCKVTLQHFIQNFPHIDLSARSILLTNLFTSLIIFRGGLHKYYTFIMFDF